jgi:hypothetical protein
MGERHQMDPEAVLSGYQSDIVICFFTNHDVAFSDPFFRPARCWRYIQPLKGSSHGRSTRP